MRLLGRSSRRHGLSNRGSVYHLGRIPAFEVAVRGSACDHRSRHRRGRGPGSSDANLSGTRGYPHLSLSARRQRSGRSPSFRQPAGRNVAPLCPRCGWHLCVSGYGPRLHATPGSTGSAHLRHAKYPRPRRTLGRPRQTPLQVPVDGRRPRHVWPFARSSGPHPHRPLRPRLRRQLRHPSS